MQHHVITSPTAQINVTLDNNTITFPVDQTLNFDFSHDTNIMAILTAFGLTQFNRYLPPTQIVDRELIVSYLESRLSKLRSPFVPIDRHRTRMFLARRRAMFTSFSISEQYPLASASKNAGPGTMGGARWKLS